MSSPRSGVQIREAYGAINCSEIQGAFSFRPAICLSAAFRSAVVHKEPGPRVIANEPLLFALVASVSVVETLFSLVGCTRESLFENFAHVVDDSGASGK
jgi:hypothetical protein